MGAHRDGEAGLTTVADMATLTRLFQEHREQLRKSLDGRMDPRLKAHISPEDVLQEAFFAAQGKWPKFKASGMTPKAWLHWIAREQLFEICRRYFGTLKRDPKKEMPWLDQLPEGLVDSLTSPSEAMARKELQERVRQALDSLAPADREILRMRHFDGLDYHDVSAILEIAPNTAMVRHARALRRFKHLLSDLGPGASGGA